MEPSAHAPLHCLRAVEEVVALVRRDAGLDVSDRPIVVVVFEQPLQQCKDSIAALAFGFRRFGLILLQERELHRVGVHASTFNPRRGGVVPNLDRG